METEDTAQEYEETTPEPQDALDEISFALQVSWMGFQWYFFFCFVIVVQQNVCENQGSERSYHKNDSKKWILRMRSRFNTEIQF